MKKILSTLIILLGFFVANAQTVTYDDFKSLIPYLKTEDWKSAFNESSKLLKSAKKDTSEFKAIVLYINIFSASGMVANGDMSYRELEKNVTKFVGQKIIMSSHPVTTREGALRQTKFSITDTTNEAFTSATNANETKILCFEKFLFKDKIDISNFSSKTLVRCGGILEKVETNPNKSMIWILRLTVNDAFARKTN